ncbi:diaminopimelate decarboxylase [soil metagenome]
MRADLPATVAAAIERQLARQRPALIFDKARLAANMQAIADAARAHEIRVLFAAKSFPHPAVWDLAAARFDGFDIASIGELATVPAARILSMADPTGGTGRIGHARFNMSEADERLVQHNALSRMSDAAHRLIVACETPGQVAAAPAHADIAIRVSASITWTDPAVGALLDGTGHRRSRFGVDRDAIDVMHAMNRAAGDRRIGLHLHHGPVTATSGERFVATARAAIELANEAGIAPVFIDLGGAWHGISDIAAAFAHVRTGIDAIATHAIEILVEPGRAIVREAGFACGRVVVARETAGRSLRVVDVSRLCHLRWSPVELVGNAPHAGTGVNTVVLGPTCSEEDLVGEWTVPPGMLDEGAPMVLRGVTGYSVAWNTSFGGVSPADIFIV